MNEELKKLYLNQWNKFYYEGSNEISDFATNPLVIKLDDEDKYKNSNMKVMFFGQETNQWFGKFGNSSLDKLLEGYTDFFGKGKCYKYGGQFWNCIKSYESKFNTFREVSLVWNNIIKVGKMEKGKPDERVIEKTISTFNVIKDEIKILSPDIIIFFTGPNYDNEIEKVFEDVIFEKHNTYDERQLAAVRSKYLPKKTYRTYHPTYLYRKGREFFNNVQEEIIKDIING